MVSTLTPGVEITTTEGLTTFPPLPAPVISLPAEIETFVLLGTDNFAPYVGRTDTLILAFLNTETGSTSLVSIPRDLYVYQPQKGMDKINTAYGMGGIDLLSQTIEYNLGVKPQHWILVHLDDFIHLVDELGGIDVPVSTPLPDDCGGIPPGVFHMDGLTALCYVRSRFSTSDFDRSRRQQEVLKVIFQRFMSLDAIPQLPGWYSKYSNTIHSDLSLPQILQMVPMAVRLASSGAVHQYQISWEDVKGWRVPETRAAVLLPLRDKILPKLQHAVLIVSSPLPDLVDPSARTSDDATGFNDHTAATPAP